MTASVFYREDKKSRLEFEAIIDDLRDKAVNRPDRKYSVVVSSDVVCGALLRLDSAIDRIWGPSRTRDQVLEEEYPDVDVNHQFGGAAIVSLRARQVVMRMVVDHEDYRPIGVWDGVPKNATTLTHTRPAWVYADDGSFIRWRDEDE